MNEVERHIRSTRMKPPYCAAGIEAFGSHQLKIDSLSVRLCISMYTACVHMFEHPYIDTDTQF